MNLPYGGSALLRWIFNHLRSYRKGSSQEGSRENIEAFHATLGSREVSPSLHSTLSKVKEALGPSPDLIIREFLFGSTKMALVQIDGMVNERYGADGILAALMRESASSHLDTMERTPLGNRDGFVDVVRERLLPILSVTKEERIERLLRAVISGDTALIVDGAEAALLCSTRGFEHRAIQEPISESGVRVPREGFTEAIRVNTSLIRRRVKDPRLWFETMEIGSVTQTDVAMCYIKGIANDEVVAEVRKRLKDIDTDSILESGYIEEYIEETPYSIFPQIFRTERPDVVVGDLLEGHVAILTDGTPFVLIVPITFADMLSVSEDYYDRSITASGLRAFRYGVFFISILAPALYIAVTTFHQEMLPTEIILTIAASREGVPFPAVVEAFLMIGAFEMLREAGLRLPRIVGPAVTIVGALVLGEQAVATNMVSSAMVIVVAFTAIASFTNPAYNLDIAARALRVFFMLGAAVLGLFGVLGVGLIVLMHLSALRSFGVPYLSPFAPLSWTDLKDTFIRVPRWAMISRPRLVGYKEPVRQDFDNGPNAPRARRGRRRDRRGEG